MAQTRPVWYGSNRCEGGLITPTGVVSGYGVERLTDRLQRGEFRDSSNSGTRRLTLDRGAGVTGEISTLILGAGHNLDGLTVEVESSPDNSAWTSRGTLAVIGSDIQRGILTTFDTRYARLNMPSPAVAPILTEWWLAPAGFVLSYLADSSFADGAVPQQAVQTTQAGIVLTAILGLSRERLAYQFKDLSPSDRAVLRAFWVNEIIGGAWPFYMEDADGTLRFVRWTNGALAFQGVAANIVRRNISLELEDFVG